MEITSTEIPDVLKIKPDLYKDRRGYFMETYREQWYGDYLSGNFSNFVQDNLSFSKKGTIRGLHYQIQDRQAKLVMVPKGEILDVAVDLRKKSPTFGKYVSLILSSENNHQMYIPEGFAHGFSVLSDQALVYYKCSDYYNEDGERGLNCFDPRLGIDWMVENPILSEKDKSLPSLDDLTENDLF